MATPAYNFRLEDVAAFPAEYIQQTLAANGVTLSSNINENIGTAAIIFASAGYMTLQDRDLIMSPHFYEWFTAPEKEVNRVITSLNTTPSTDRVQNVRFILQNLHRLNAQPVVPVELPVVHTINKELADLMHEIHLQYELEKDTYRSKIYENAANSIANHQGEITSGKMAMSIKGIGKSVATDIDQYLQKGSIDRLETLRFKNAERKGVIDLFTSVYGIGPVAALKYYAAGYRTLLELWNSPNITEAQRIGLQYWSDFQQKVPREEIDRVKSYLAPVMSQLGLRENDDWVIGGSYRRLEPQSGDIDILVKSRPGVNLRNIVDHLTRDGLLVAHLALGERKYMGVLKISPEGTGRRVDIRFFEPNTWAYALLYNTGSQAVNIIMRQRAIDMGLRLNEYGMTDGMGRSYPADTEEQIFGYLGLRYLRPEERLRTLTYMN